MGINKAAPDVVNGGMDNIFNDCSNLKTIYAGDKFVTTDVTNLDRMFSGTTYNFGTMSFGWQYVTEIKQLRYFDVDGHMLKNTTTPDGIILDATGQVIS